MTKSKVHDVIFSNDMAFPDEQEMLSLRQEDNEAVAKELYEILKIDEFPASSKAFEAILLLNPDIRNRFIAYVIEKMGDADLVTILRRMTAEEYMMRRQAIWSRLERMSLNNPSYCVAASGRIRDVGDKEDALSLRRLARRTPGLDRNGDKVSNILLDYAEQIEVSLQ